MKIILEDVKYCAYKFRENIFRTEKIQTTCKLKQSRIRKTTSIDLIAKPRCNMRLPLNLISQNSTYIIS